jgi:hydroxypyruvate isomerase
MRSMLAFSANISTLFTDLPLPLRFAVVEQQVPCSHPADKLAQVQQEADQWHVLHEISPGARAGAPA